MLIAFILLNIMSICCKIMLCANLCLWWPSWNFSGCITNTINLKNVYLGFSTLKILVQQCHMLHCDDQNGRFMHTSNDGGHLGFSGIMQHDYCVMTKSTPHSQLKMQSCTFKSHLNAFGTLLSRYIRQKSGQSGHFVFDLLQPLSDWLILVYFFFLIKCPSPNRKTPKKLLQQFVQGQTLY